jgi:hypothetical protein
LTTEFVFVFKSETLLSLMHYSAVGETVTESLVHSFNLIKQTSAFLFSDRNNWNCTSEARYYYYVNWRSVRNWKSEAPRRSTDLYVSDDANHKLWISTNNGQLTCLPSCLRFRLNLQIIRNTVMFLYRRYNVFIVLKYWKASLSDGYVLLLPDVAANLLQQSLPR